MLKFINKKFYFAKSIFNIIIIFYCLLIAIINNNNNSFLNCMVLIILNILINLLIMFLSKLFNYKDDKITIKYSKTFNTNIYHNSNAPNYFKSIINSNSIIGTFEVKL